MLGTACPSDPSVYSNQLDWHYFCYSMVVLSDYSIIFYILHKFMPLFIDTAGCDNWSADELISKTKLYLVVSSIVSLGSDNIAFIDFIAQYFLNLETL